ncbi:hypothetical protein [Rhizobium leguminosarum]|uniref:hypothetical protein n=1 Tax=Rhizobium leguminosarum TaxID=384 RepID=UPI001C92A06B|nr:hypothetical protein [Rhizobium leguminosarum]MBY2926710.1 hypothetical protein [Rhizobium leguminosarum]MBY2937104.1 hypothetical protein [Rhizobium leguminosarum]MBY3027013.1 hypothetical protein [Rhizobium leguminosarum]
MLNLYMIDGGASVVYDRQPVAEYPRRVDRRDVAEMILVDGHERPCLSRLGIVDPSRLEDGI